jgi:Uma2 family endonuclease
MGRAGIFSPDAPLELLEGVIYQMSPIGSPHAACVKYLNTLLNRLFSGKMLVGVQDPIRLNDFSEPKPDITLLRWRDDYYKTSHPTPADVLLVIEVADSTVESDRSYKMPLYAKAGITEAWLVNLGEECVELYAEPEGDAYQTVRRFTRGEAVAAHSIEKLKIGVSDILG